MLRTRPLSIRRRLEFSTWPNFYGQFSKTFALMAPNRAEPWRIPRKSQISRFQAIRYPISAYHSGVPKRIPRSTITACRERWWPFSDGKYRFNRASSKLYLDRRHIDPFPGLKKWTSGWALNFIWPPVRVYGGFVSNTGKVGKDETAARDQNKSPARRAKTNTRREPTLRTNETAAEREDQPKHRTRTSEKGKRNHHKRGTAKAKGGEKGLTATSSSP